MTDYKKICFDILKELKPRHKEVLVRRFCLDKDSSKDKPIEKETLDSIGRKFGITRERVRQIEEDSMNRIKSKVKNYEEVFNFFKKELEKTGGVRKEDVFLNSLNEGKFKQQIFFLLNLSDDFVRFGENDNFYSSWSLGFDRFEKVKNYIDLVIKRLKEIKKPVELSFFKEDLGKDFVFFEYFIEISKLIQKNSEGLVGFVYWPEINPKNIRDKAFLVLKKAGRPIHFKEVARLIGPEALVQSVHNELIKDSRFVLVGRGTYALREWGFKDGDVKDIILDILKEEKRPLSKEELIERVLKQRFVKRNTVLLNLSNKKYFIRTNEGKYTISEA
jgi:hypothetical protein